MANINYADKVEEPKTQPKENTQSPTNKKKSGWISILKILISIVVIISATYILRLYVIEPFVIPSSSMESTILINDHILSEKLTYKNQSPKKGDIVTFESLTEPGTILIKRVIATEGQTIEFKDNKVFIDGIEQHEDYIHNLPTEEFPDELEVTTINYPYTVPEGHVWVMGDNRINSSDSRAFGAIPITNITGKAIGIYYPFERIQLF